MLKSEFSVNSWEVVRKDSLSDTTWNSCPITFIHLMQQSPILK